MTFFFKGLIWFLYAKESKGRGTSGSQEMSQENVTTIWVREDGGSLGAFMGGVRFWIYSEGRAGFPDGFDME